MAFQAVPDTVEIDMIFTLNSEPAQNVFYAKLEGGYNLANLEDLAAQIDVQWQGTWRGDQPAEVVYIRTEVRGLAVENDLIASNSDSANPGSHIGVALPNNVTFSIKKESGFTGRSARGRTYWIGILTEELTEADENFLEAAYVAILVANVDSIRIGIEAVGDWEPVLVSRFAGGLKRDEGETFPWVSTTNVDTRVDTLRARLPN